MCTESRKYLPLPVLFCEPHALTHLKRQMSQREGQSSQEEVTNCLRNCLLLSTLSLSEPKGEVHTLHSKSRLKTLCPRPAATFDPFNTVSIHLMCFPLPKFPVLMVAQSNPLMRRMRNISPHFTGNYTVKSHG